MTYLTMTSTDTENNTFLYQGERVFEEGMSVRDARRGRGRCVVKTNFDLVLPSPLTFDKPEAVEVKYEWGYAKGFAVLHLAYAMLSHFMDTAEIPLRVIKLFASDIIAVLPKDNWRIGETFFYNWLEAQAYAQAPND